MPKIVSRSGRFTARTLAAAGLLLMGSSAFGETRLGGHFGVVHPIVTFGHKTTTIGDKYTVGFPFGITLRKSDTFAVDFEFVPFVDEGHKTTLLVHPGVLFGLGNHWTFGMRAAFEIDQDKFGFTPLLNRAFKVGDNTFFGEFVLPVRFTEDEASVTMALHLGVAF